MNINEIVEELKQKYPEVVIELAKNVIKPNRKTYASKLTKEDLQKLGVIDVDFDSLIVYGHNGPLKYYKNKKGYLMVHLYDIDENGDRIKIPRMYKYRKKDGTIGEFNSYIYKIRPIGLHRVLWAWKYGKVRTGKVIDHIDNHHTCLDDYRLENLQEITPWENLRKERANYGTRLEKVKHIEWVNYYFDKLQKLMLELEIAKEAHDTKKCQNISNNMGCIKAKLRYICQKIEKEENF